MDYPKILEAYNEYNTFYYMNEQQYLDNDIDIKIAEYLATKEAIKEAIKLFCK